MKSILISLGTAFVLFSCATAGSAPFHQTAPYVDPERFSGDWYVIALLPTAVEKNIANGIENYTFHEDGTIKVTYTFRKGSPEGKEKVMYQKGWIYDSGSNAEWRVRPLWPLKLPYYILEIDEAYSYTAVGTNNYKYLWIMARKPSMDKKTLDGVLGRMESRGYDLSKLIYMEQNW